MKKRMLSMIIATAVVSNTIASNAAFALTNENNTEANQIETGEGIESGDVVEEVEAIDEAEDKTVEVVNIAEEVQVLPQADVLNIDFSKNTANDFSLNKNEYSIVGNPIIKDSEEKGTKVAALDGKSAYVYKFDDSKYDDMRTEEGVAIEVTFKYDEVPTSGEHDIFSNQQSGGIGIGLEKGKLQFYCNVNGSYKQPSTTIEAGVWYHAVGTYDGNVAKLYLNGELVNSIEAKGSVTFTSNSNAKNFVIGGDSNSSNSAEFLSKGEVQSAKLYSKALSESEVKAVYEAKDIPVISFEGEITEMELNKEIQLPIATSSNSKEVKLTVTDPNGALVEIVDNKITPKALGPYTFKYEVAIDENKTLVSVIKKNVVSYENSLLNFGIVSSDSVNLDSVINLNFHVNKSENTYVDKVEFDVVYDKNALTYEEVSKQVDNVTISKVESGKLHIVVGGGITTANFVKYSDTLKSRIKFRANDSFEGTETEVKYENIKVIYNGNEIKSENVVQNKTINIRSEKELDLNGDGVIGVGDVALAKNEEEAKTIAEQSKIHPYKHVVIVTTDGGGVSFRPDKMYYAKNSLTIPSLKDDAEILAKRNNPYAMNLFNEIAATSYTAQSEMPAISAQNYTSIIHGAEYKSLPSEYKIDNTYTSSYYFPDFEKEEDQYPSVFKSIKNQLPTSNTAAFAEWYQIVNGVVEPDSGANLFEVENESGKSMGFSEIADYIKSEDFKDTSLVYLQSDYMDHIGHSLGYYTDVYYEELQKYDEYYENLINSLVESGTMDETLLVFNSDHGGTFTGHGSLNGASDRDIQIAIVGETIDNGKRLNGGTNHDISPIALYGLRLEKPDSMNGSAEFAKEAFLSQEELVKKEREIEKVTASVDKSVNTVQLTLGNCQDNNEIKTIDIVMNIGDNEVSKVKTEGNVLRQSTEDGKLYLTVSYESVTEDLLRVVFANDIADDCKVEEYMIATTTGDEIYGDLVNIAAEVTVADKQELSNLVDKANKLDKDIYTEESLKVFTESLEMAEGILDDKNALQSEVYKALSDLQGAIDSLVKKDENTGNPDDTEKPENPGSGSGENDDNNSGTGSGNNGSGNNGGANSGAGNNGSNAGTGSNGGNSGTSNGSGNKLPQTGGANSLLTIALGALTAIGGALSMKKKK